MKPIVVTGARGYIGNALVKRFSEGGHPLRLVSRAATAAAVTANNSIQHIKADLRHEADWSALVDGAEAVIHLSSRTDLRAAESDPVGDYDLNVEPIKALIQAAGHAGVAMPVIFASTATIVGVEHGNPVSELTPDRPCSVYDRHKVECERILRDATSRGIVRACSLRLSNVYGHGVSSINSNRGVLNAVMRRAGQGEPLTIYDRGEYVRDFTFVGDVVDAFCRALATEQVCNGGSYIIATGRGHTLAEAFQLVADEAFRCTGRHVEIVHRSELLNLHPIERRNFVGDSSLFQMLTGWRVETDLPAGIHDYYKHYVADCVPTHAA